MPSIAGRRVLVVEDDYLLACDLTKTFTECGAFVLGPTPTLRRAMELAADAEFAVLDVRLRDGLVFPLADRLKSAGVPFVFYSACGEIETPLRFRTAGRLKKPGDVSAAIRALLGSDAAQSLAGGENVVLLLPKLRLLARLLVDDAAVSDRLVERALTVATEARRWRDPRQPLWDWLAGILLDEARRRGPRLMN